MYSISTNQYLATLQRAHLVVLRSPQNAHGVCLLAASPCSDVRGLSCQSQTKSRSDSSTGCSSSSSSTSLVL
ncbi:hypothetical protein MtrunA17_Chr8g0356401 [Medicago truncatula]|uniref:Uncharacterized protein n=1 Tax=Medicago truncatula TaxID=3880 RepID=A0A396GPH3_MEDTR|nr:hypothetical protein MtrunA17_Chr8g0356401 [Medicago truncatula]